MKKVILLVVILMFSCKNKKNKDDNKADLKVNKLGFSTELREETRLTKEEDFVGEIKYITAKSGLIYRDKPKGKRLGRFDFNDKIIITEHTNVFQEIKNRNETIKGEWVGTKLNNNIVFVFGGFISDEKTKITTELVKEFMGDNFWISEGFKNNLEKTKSFRKAHYPNEGGILHLKFESDYLDNNTTSAVLSGYILNAQDDVYIPLKGLLENEVSRIIKINYKKLVIGNNDIAENLTFLNNGNESAYDFFKNWFKGVYSFKDENGIQKYNSKEITYFSDLAIDYFQINEKKYRVEDINGDTYQLSEIQFIESDNDAVKWANGGDFDHDLFIFKETGREATLTKIN